MRVFRNAWFGRFSRKENISDELLLDAVHRAEEGLIDADLGGGVIKQRIARPGGGKSKGYRSVVIYRRADRAFFVFGFPKSDQANISKEEESFFKKMAKEVLLLTDEQLQQLIDKGKFEEVVKDDQKISQ